MSDLHKSLLSRRNKRTGPNQSSQNFLPTKWDKYFDKEFTIALEQGKFNLYSKGDKGPVILCLHGGGYSGLTWSLFAADIYEAIDCQIVALDLRGHGKTLTNDDGDLSLDTLAKDVVDVANKLSEDIDESIVLVGHSMGGAVAVEASNIIKNIAGLCVIDVVEGTALDALSSMQSLLRGRPTTFKSLQHAIQWCFKGGQTHNIEAAKVSMPGQIVNIKTGTIAADECDVESEPEVLTNKTAREVIASAYTLSEVAEEESGTSEACTDCGKPPLPKSLKTDTFTPPNNIESASDSPKYTWRINLSKTENFWSGWFKGLSQKFLDLRVPKILLLANIHGLDTALTVGQMQGKFQLQVLSKSGHAIHEDQPQHVSEIISGYLVKQRLATLKEGYSNTPMPCC